MASHCERLESQHQVWQTSEIRWSWIRLLTFAGGVAGLILLRDVPAAALSAGAGGIVLFFLSVRVHRERKWRAEFGEWLVRMADESLARCGGAILAVRSSDRPDDAEESENDDGPVLDGDPAWPLTEQERDDLDLYARPVGVFGLLNRCSMAFGARRLRDMLENPCLSAGRLHVRQACVKWLTDHPDRRVELMAAAARLRDQDERVALLIKTVRAAEPVVSASWALALRVWSIPCIVLAVAALVQAGQGSYTLGWPLLGVLCINGLVTWRIRPMLRPVLDPWRELPLVLRSLHFIAERSAEVLPEVTELHRHREMMRSLVDSRVLPALASRLGWVDVGGFLHVLCNLLFFYDLHVARSVLRCVVPHKQAILDALRAQADLEALCSLACFAWEQPHRGWPEVDEDDQAGMAIEEGLHPLIEPAEAVANSIRLTTDERTWVITGSNMAGKSTLLRMVGVNLLLAQIGTAATARSMRLRPHRLMTDLRIRDDLAKHESYFLAEVRQLRRMLCDEPHAVAPLLGLIDEPFRGTNSQERVAADVALVAALINSPNRFLVATHEQELADLATRTTALNYHFHEDLTDSGPVFDYRLRAGPATTRNALNILEREGYPADMVRHARDVARRAEQQRQ